MSYETTAVPVSRTQEAIRELILRNGGTGIAFVSEPPHEGFEAKVVIDKATYRIRIAAKVRTDGDIEQDIRRVWRVLFYHLKSVYEAASSGVMEFREMMLPYIVTNSGRTIAEQILPKLHEAISGNTSRLLGDGNRGL